jgi:hypothetical protein
MLALHYACWQGKAEPVHMLLQWRSPVNDFYDIDHKLVKASTNITSLSLMLIIISTAFVVCTLPVALGIAIIAG